MKKSAQRDAKTVRWL